MDAAATLRTARLESGLSQAELARRAGTSQATISAYESGSKQPALSTLERLLAATGHRLDIRPEAPTRQPSAREIERRGRILAQVLSLAEALPAKRRSRLRYPSLNPLQLRAAGSPKS